MWYAEETEEKLKSAKHMALVTICDIHKHDFDDAEGLSGTDIDRLRDAVHIVRKVCKWEHAKEAKMI